MTDRVIGCVVAAALAGTTTATAVADDWQTGVGGNFARNSLSTGTGPTSPEILWTGSRPAIVAQQGVCEGDLLVLSRIASFTIPTGTWIVGHDLHTGAERWAVQLPYDFPGSSWRSRVSAIHEGQVYATRAGNTNLDYLYALSPVDGSIIWRSVDLIDEGTTESLVFAANGDIIAGNFSSLLRIDRTDGTTVWDVPRSCPTTGGCSASVFGDRVYIWEANAMGPQVSVFDIATGAFLYAGPGIGGGFIQQLGLFVGPDGTVYAPRTQNNPVTDFFVAFEDTGTALVEKWRLPLGYVPFASFGVGPDGSVYSYSPDLEIQRIDPEKGNVIDTSVSLGDNSPRMAIDATGTLFVTNGGFDQGKLFSFDADLSVRWVQFITNVNVGGPVLGEDGVLVVCGVGDDVRAYRTAPCDGDVDGDGVVGFDDLLLVLAEWGPCPGCPEDIDGDDEVGFPDLLIVLAEWGDCS
jgi:outer membrane protein assembly factor BamB